MKSRLIKEINSLAKEVSNIGDNIVNSQYYYWHDEDFNLYMKMPNQETIKIPILDFRFYQTDIQKILFSGKSKRILVSWPRRAGKEVVSWNIITHAAIIDPGMYIMTYPTNVRARKILWEGAALINGVSTPFINMVPDFLISKLNGADMTMKLINGSIIWIVGCDIDPGKLRGTNARGMVMSELAYSDPRVLYTMLPVFRQNGGWLLGQSTYDGMNHFYHMIKNNKNDPNWYCREESILTLVDEKGIPYISEEDVEEDRRSGMPEYLIQQEYYGNVQVNEETKYFAHAINQIYESGRIVSELFVPNKKVYAFYDIGVSDCTAITLAQFEGRGSKLWPVIIGYIENNNRDLRFYVDEIRRFCNRYNLPMGLHAIPHDGKNRSFNDGLKNTLDYLQEMGEQGIFVNRPSSHKVAIESIRQKLFMSAFNKENTQRLIDCLSNYEKEFDEKLGRYKDSPVHDWSSHGVKSFQTLALALEADLIVETSYDVIYLQ
jgi:phage terminase large subunit